MTCSYKNRYSETQQTKRFGNNKKLGFTRIFEDLWFLNEV